MLRAVTILALFSVLLQSAPARAQEGEPSVTILALETVSPTQTKGVAAGDRLEASFRIENGAAAPLVLRRIVLQAGNGVEAIPGEADSIDNDGDGEVDELDERFSRSDAEGSIWRFRDDTEILPPGAVRERRVRLLVTERFVPGRETSLVLSVGGSLRDGERSLPRRSRIERPLPLRQPVISIKADTGDLRGGSEWPVALALDLPPGSIPEMLVALDLPPSVREATPISASLPEDLQCDREPVIREAGERLVWSLGACRIIGTGAQLELGLVARLRDADSTASDEAIAEHRRFALTADLADRETALAATSLAAWLSGPLLAVEIDAGRGGALRPGESAPLTLAMFNRGDRAARGRSLSLESHEVFSCFELVEKPEAGCATSHDITDALEPGARERIGLRARLRRDAALEVPPALALTLDGAGFEAVSLSADGFRLRAPTSPELLLASAEEWTEAGPEDGGFLRAAIGQAGRLRLKGRLPEGRYTGEIRLLARRIRAQTGEPLGPALLSLDDPALSIAGARSAAAEIETAYSDIWASYTIPVAPHPDGVPRDWRLELAARLLDDPPLRAGQMVEITAEMRAYAGMTAASSSWIEILVEEPSLQPKLFSLDSDRLLAPGDPMRFAVLVCNYGDAPAHDAVARVDFAHPSLAQAARVERRLVPGPAGSGGTLSEIAAPMRAAAESERVGLSADDASLRLFLQDGSALPGGQCLGGLVAVPRGERNAARTASVETVRLTVEPYRSGKGARARIHPSLQAPPLTFRTSVLELSAPPRGMIDAEGNVRHVLSLEVPSDVPAQRLSLDLNSSGDMRWTVRFRGSREPRELRWRDGVTLDSGERLVLLFDGKAPKSSPLGWADTTTVALTAIAETGTASVTTARLVTVANSTLADAVRTEKRLALDRDCDGDLDDEQLQDAVFEPVKDAAVGDCIVFRIAFRNVGSRALEKIAIRDRVSPFTRLLPESVGVREVPRGEEHGETLLPAPGDPVIGWDFEGLFETGSEGEVTYAVQLERNPRLARP